MKNTWEEVIFVSLNLDETFLTEGLHVNFEFYNCDLKPSHKINISKINV